MERSIGQIIREKRSLKGITQEQLAAEVGVTPQAVSKWENDLAYPDITLLKSIARVLECRTWELLGEEQPEVSMTTKDKVDMSKLVLRIRMVDGNDKVSVNLPVGALDVLLNSGMIEGMFEGKAGALKSIDFNAIMRMASIGSLGKIVTMESEDDGRVDIYIEEL